MAGVPADSADDVGGKVALIRTVVFAVTNFPTILACLVLIISQGTVECGKLTKLVTLKSVLTFGNRRSLNNESQHNALCRIGKGD